MRFGSLSTAVLALPSLLGLADGVLAVSGAQCNPVAKSCSASAHQAAPCTALFVKSKVKRPTCTIYPLDATVTKQVIPTTTTTKTITQTITQTITTVTSASGPTIIVTETREVFETETGTTSVTIALTETETISTVFSTTTFSTDYGFTCTNKDVKRNALPTVELEDSGLVKRTALPKCCGCFLTSTKTAARQTKTVTTTLPKVTVINTITQTTTATSITTGIASTSTLYETATETIKTTLTELRTTTETATETVGAIETAVYDPCSDFPRYTGRNGIIMFNATRTEPRLAVGTAENCCRFCYSTPGCGFFLFFDTFHGCYIYLAKATATSQPDTQCRNDFCPNGRIQTAQFTDRPPNEIYGFGPCAGEVKRAGG